MHNSLLRSPFEGENKMLPKDSEKAYREFYNTARNNNILDPKTTLMIHIASAMAFACYPWMEHYLGVSKEEGLTDEEIGAVQSIVMAVSAGRINAQLREVRSRGETTLWGYPQQVHFRWNLVPTFKCSGEFNTDFHLQESIIIIDFSGCKSFNALHENRTGLLRNLLP